MSSVGLIKGDVFVSTSASVTNASYFRHALALDERRVKFMPEYFQEMNAHRNNMLRPNADGDIQEVWFSGCHADVYVVYQSIPVHKHDKFWHTGAGLADWGNLTMLAMFRSRGCKMKLLDTI